MGWQDSTRTSYSSKHTRYVTRNKESNMQSSRCNWMAQCTDGRDFLSHCLVGSREALCLGVECACAGALWKNRMQNMYSYQLSLSRKGVVAFRRFLSFAAGRRLRRLITSAAVTMAPASWRITCGPGRSSMSQQRDTPIRCKVPFRGTSPWTACRVGKGRGPARSSSCRGRDTPSSCRDGAGRCRAPKARGTTTTTSQY